MHEYLVYAFLNTRSIPWNMHVCRLCTHVAIERKTCAYVARTHVFMYLCVYVDVSVYVGVYVCAYVHVFVYVYLHVYVYVYVCICVLVYVYVHLQSTCICMCTCVCRSIYLHVHMRMMHMYTYVFVYMYIHIWLRPKDIWLATGPGGLFATRLVTESGGLATNLSATSLPMHIYI